MRACGRVRGREGREIAHTVVNVRISMPLRNGSERTACMETVTVPARVVLHNQHTHVRVPPRTAIYDRHRTDLEHVCRGLRRYRARERERETDRQRQRPRDRETER